MTMIRAASDVGGTFTDLVYFEVDEQTGQIQAIKTEKAHTTPPNFESGVLNTLNKTEIDYGEIGFLAHGTTVVINALTERKGAKTGLITTRGFRDILEIARGNRPDFFNLQYRKPEPFIPRYLRREITQRMSYKGEVLTPLDESEISPIVEQFKADGVEAIAVCFLHSYANPEHEQQVCEHIKTLWPEVSVVASSQISREWREYERTNTAALCAYVQPAAERYLSRMEHTLGERGFDGSFYIMQSNGGIDTVKAVKQTPITIVESGPASGVLGAASLGKMLGIENIIAFDIGGTTAKCSLIDHGHVATTSQYMIERSDRSAGYPIMTPVVDIVEIGNGGGSIGWVDDHGKMHVGPQSAGALPGPVAYGKGGIEPTTTDANLMLARINPNYFIGGEITADMQAVEAAFQRLGDQLNMTPQEAALGVVRIANHNMTNALKLVSINRGYDPRDFIMIAFGGGGAMHATSLAAELNIPTVIIPAHSAVFSAWGMLMSDLRRDYVRTLPTALTENQAGVISATMEEMVKEATDAYLAEGIAAEDIYFERLVDMRYSGQAHSVRIKLPPGTLSAEEIAALRKYFHAAYEREYTYRLDNDVELVSYNLVAFAAVDRPELQPLPPGGSLADAMKETRKVNLDQHGCLPTAIYDRDRLPAGAEFSGPAVVEESGSTTVVFPNQSVRVDEYGNLHIRIMESS